MPVLWLASDRFAYLFVLQIYSGLGWAAFELATLLLFLTTIPTGKRMGVLTIFNLANAAAIACGSFLGAGILAVMGTNRQAYLVLFAVSALARAGALLLLVRLPRTAPAASPGPFAGRLVRGSPTASVSSPCTATNRSRYRAPSPAGSGLGLAEEKLLPSVGNALRGVPRTSLCRERPPWRSANAEQRLSAATERHGGRSLQSDPECGSTSGFPA